MKEYILKADNRRPLKFSGELLGQSDAHSEAKLKAEVLWAANDHKSGYAENWTHTRLYLYRTEGEKYILHTQRFCFLEDDSKWKLEAVSGQIDIHESLEAYVESAKKKNDSYGILTVGLLNNVVSNHPELEEFWVETID